MENIISDKIFDFVKAFGENVVLFTQEGESTLDSDEAKRFYLKDSKIMIHYDTSESKSEIRVSYGGERPIQEFKKLFDGLKAIANKNLIEFSLQKFSKQIEPKDFAYQGKVAMQQNTMESYGKPYGYSKTSYQDLKDSKIIIKHKKAVDEEVRGSRSRNIQAIYLENSAGERFQYPHNHLAGARAMLRHVKEGGTPYDYFGQHIIEQSKELSDLYKFERWVNKNGLIEGNDDVVEVVKEQKNKIREHIKKLQSQSYYESCSCEYKHNKQTTSPAKVNKMRERFTAKHFDEGLNDALGVVTRLMKEADAKTEARDNAVALAKYIQDKKMIGFKGVEVDDPANPEAQDPTKFSGPSGVVAKISAMAGYLAQRTTDDTVSNHLARISDDVHMMHPKLIMGVKKVIDYLYKNATMSKEAEESGSSIEHQAVESLEESFENFIPKF